MAAIIGQASPPSLGNLRGGGRPTNWDGGSSRTRTAIPQVLQLRRFWIRDGEARRSDAPWRRHFHGASSVLRGFRARKDVAVSSGFHASVSVLQMDAFSSFINPRVVFTARLNRLLLARALKIKSGQLRSAKELPIPRGVSRRPLGEGGDTSSRRCSVSAG